MDVLKTRADLTPFSLKLGPAAELAKLLLEYALPDEIFNRPGPPRGGQASFAFSTVNRFRTALLHGWAGRLMVRFCDCRSGWADAHVNVMHLDSSGRFYKQDHATSKQAQVASLVCITRYSLHTVY